MTTATRQEVLGLYRRIFRLARKWQAASGQMEDTIKEKQYILNEARTLFEKNKNVSVQLVNDSASSEDPHQPGDGSQARESFQRSLSSHTVPVASHSHKRIPIPGRTNKKLIIVLEKENFSRQLTDTDLIKQCIDECTARIEIGLHYKIPYPRPIHVPPMGLTPLRGRGFRSQEKLRKLSKPVYLKSHDEVS
ncbi:LYR motif-containing protein 1 isoform X1 [Manis javanica]|uniref:LYR motif-containing protein 1 isoform X1 n=1 Tax=Manis javanica TaxID=9974 RepID=UPI003C6CF55A